MKSVTKIVAVDFKKIVEVTVKTTSVNNMSTRRERQSEHDMRVDAVVEALAQKFHYKNITVA